MTYLKVDVLEMSFRFVKTKELWGTHSSHSGKAIVDYYTPISKKPKPTTIMLKQEKIRAITNPHSVSSVADTRLMLIAMTGTQSWITNAWPLTELHFTEIRALPCLDLQD